MRRFLLLLLVALLCGMSAPAQEVRVRSPWNIEGAACRVMVAKGGETFVLARVPASVNDKPVAAVRVFYDMDELPASVVWADEEGVTVLADARSVPAGGRAGVKFYPIPGDALAAPVPAAARVKDPTPLWGVARRTAGMDFPRSLGDLKMLETRFDRQPKYFAAADFAGLPATSVAAPEGWFMGDWTRMSHLVDLQTWLLVPADASFMFGLSGVSPAWLLVDGEPVLEHPPYRPADTWTTSKAVKLKAGLRRVQVRTVCRARLDTVLAWKRTGEEGAAADVVMVTGSSLLKGRLEWRDDRIHPYAVVAAGQAYRFSGLEGAFVPFTCSNETRCATATEASSAWQVNGVPTGEGRTNTVTLRTTDLPADLKLTVRWGENGESNAEHTCEMTFDGPVWAEYDVTSRMAGVPAVCYPGDVVKPIIRIRTTAPDGMAFTLDSTVQWRGGGKTNISATVATANGWAQVYLCPFEVAAAESLAWTLSHAGAVVSEGSAVFVREPFGVLPDSVSGDCLKSGDVFVVLIAAHASRGEPVAAPGRGRGKVALLDGFLTAEAGLDESNLMAQWHRVDLRALERREDAPGMTWLLPFAEVKSVLPAATVIFAPSLTEASLQGGVAAFERRVAAMAGLLSGPACGSPRVILVVPPEFDVLPGCGCVPEAKPCEHAKAASVYAEAIIRVADVYALETVNLFNAFKTMQASVPLVRDGGLTPEGAALASGLLIKKIGH